MRSTTITSLSKGLLRGSSCAGSRGCQQESQQQQQQQQPRRCAASLGSNRGRSNHRSGFDGFAASPAPAATVVSPSAKEANLDHAKFKPGCVIFDKDGTLVCFHTMWSPWCTSLANRMSKSTGMTRTSRGHSTTFSGTTMQRRRSGSGPWLKTPTHRSRTKSTTCFVRRRVLMSTRLSG